MYSSDRENYLVLKIQDIMNYLTKEELQMLYCLSRKIQLGRLSDGKQALQCVCIESDWSCYESAWELVKAELEDRQQQDPKE